MFEKILVYLDVPGAGGTILPLIAQLAGRFDSKVVLLNVIVVQPIVAVLGKTEIEPVDSEELPESEEADSYLNRIAEAWRKQGLNVECVTIEGTIEESIITYARTFQISLIAFAVRDRSIFNRFTVGSASGIVFRKSGIPVLSISG
jgi:nucleotide-binding universal stress UspA family protein